MPPPASDNPRLSAARAYAALGWRIVQLHSPVFGDGETVSCTCGRPGCSSAAGKHPRDGKWQDTATADAGRLQFRWDNHPDSNVGVLLGTRSNIVAVDIDPPGGEARLAELAAGDLPVTVELRTGKGRSLIYRIPDGLVDVPRTTILADADGNEALRLQGGPKGAQRVLPPSIHPGGRLYEWAEGRSPFDIEPAPMPVWLLAEMCRPEQAPRVNESAAANVHAPGGDYNKRGSWADLLGAHGYKPAGGRGDIKYYTRPGKTGGTSATLGYYKASDGTPALYMFSGNAHPLAAGKCYDLFGAYTLLEHHGNFSAAAKALAGLGYGEPARGRARTAPAGGSTSDAGESVPAEAAEWPAVIPLEDTAEEPPPFPVEVLPAPIADYVRAIAEAINCPVDFPAVAVLAATSAAIGAAAEVQIHGRFRQGAGLYFCTVGDSSAKKSPPIKEIIRPVTVEQCRRVEGMSGRKIEMYEHGEGELLVSDITVEKLGEMLLKQPRGLLLFRQELVGWLSSLNQYKAKGVGADRPFFLEVYDNDTITIHRKNMPEGLHVPHPCLTIIGATQPDILREWLVRRDGLVERILWTFPKRVPQRGARWGDVPEKLGKGWENALTNLWRMGMQKWPDRKRPSPHLYPLALSGRPAWQDFTDRLADVMNDAEFPESLAGTYGKFEGTAARLALVLQLLSQATPDAGEPSGGEITARWVKAGGDLAFYFGRHFRRVVSACGKDSRITGAQKILDWIRRAGRPVVSQADAWRSFRNNQLFKCPEDLVGPFRLLQSHNCVKWLPPEDEGDRRVRTAHVYAVNPALISSVDDLN